MSKDLDDLIAKADEKAANEKAAKQKTSNVVVMNSQVVNKQPVNQQPTSNSAIILQVKPDLSDSAKRYSRTDAKKTNWIWNDYLAKGHLHLLSGLPGAGKTNIAVNLMSIITRGGSFPDGSVCKVGHTIMWSNEDSIEETLIVRAIANDACLNKLWFLDNDRADVDETQIELAKQYKMAKITTMSLLLERLENTITKIQNESGTVDLIVLDPILYFINGDANKAADVQKSLAPLIRFARRFKVAVLGVCHYNKNSLEQTPILKVLGSQAFVGCARICFGATIDGTGYGTFARIKSNLSKCSDGFKFTIDPVAVGVVASDGNEKDFAIGNKIAWKEEVFGNPQDILSNSTKELEIKKEERHSALEEAKKFLLDILHDGSQPCKEVIKAGEEACIKKRTLERAREALGRAIELKKVNNIHVWILTQPNIVDFKRGDNDR